MASPASHPDAAGAPAARDGAALDALVERVRDAGADGSPLRIVGRDTKAWYGREGSGEPLSVAGHSGIVEYAPTELVITARAGTRLAELDAALAEHGQMLGFEPPACGGDATLGGAIATGLSGPARPWLGAARDFVLGVDLLNGRGEVLRFGGQVMKNVAGFDVSRLVTGALGALGVITRVSLRVLPRPAVERTLTFAVPRAEAHARMLDLARRPWPLTAMAVDGDALRVRVAGSAAAVDDAVRRLAPDSVSETDPFWTALREARLPAPDDAPLWRLTLPPAAPDPALGEPAAPLLDWGGAQRWLVADVDRAVLDRHCAAHGGHATQHRAGTGGQRDTVFAEPPEAQRRLLERVKRAFDPQGVLNPGRQYAWL